MVGLACTHALLALLELGEELKVAWDLSSHDSCLCAKTREDARRKVLRGLTGCAVRDDQRCVYVGSGFKVTLAASPIRNCSPAPAGWPLTPVAE